MRRTLPPRLCGEPAPRGGSGQRGGSQRSPRRALGCKRGETGQTRYSSFREGSARSDSAVQTSPAPPAHAPPRGNGASARQYPSGAPWGHCGVARPQQGGGEAPRRSPAPAPGLRGSSATTAAPRTAPHRITSHRALPSACPHPAWRPRRRSARLSRGSRRGRALPRANGGAEVRPVRAVPPWSTSPPRR